MYNKWSASIILYPLLKETVFTNQERQPHCLNGQMNIWIENVEKKCKWPINTKKINFIAIVVIKEMKNKTVTSISPIRLKKLIVDNMTFWQRCEKMGAVVYCWCK